ncbi:MAG: sulfatase-like hydrolase/transferase [Beijerinckiaceae bacterium]|nr:sulfatase-like hydrolase/transferase [Beijerinckiaceae bacterium]
MLRSLVASLLPGKSAAAPVSGAAAPSPGARARAFAFPAALALWTLFLFAVEDEILPRLLVAAFFFGSFGFVYAVSGRRWFSLALVALAFVAVYLCSALKFSMVAMNLHAYDALFYLFSFAQLNFFWQTFPLYALIALAGVASLVALLLTLWWRERPAAMGRIGYSALALAGLLVTGATGSVIAGRGASFFDPHRHIFSAFIGSLADIPQLMSARGYLQISAQASLAPIPMDAIACRPEGTAPDIVLFLNESLMPPAVYPQINFPEETKPFFKSFDGRIHNMRVETFGGGTWLTDFSALTGLSTSMFGNMRNFAAQLTTGRLRHTLPQYLKACGYDTAIIYPSLAEFAGSAKFYRSIGFDRVIDRSTHKAPDERQRDAFYYNEVRKVLDRAGTGEGGKRRPQFIVASSMSPHSPWNFRFAPEAVKPGETTRWNADPEIDEYLWRIVLAKRDRDAFRADLKQAYPERPFLFVSYGDHQPALTRLPLANAEAIAQTGSAWQLDPTSKAFQTYFAIEGQGFTPQIAMPDAPILEVPHLATLTVAAAGLPLDPVYARRLRLLEQCKGLYMTCEDRGAVMAFQRWLVDAGWIAQR